MLGTRRLEEAILQQEVLVLGAHIRHQEVQQVLTMIMQRSIPVPEEIIAIVHKVLYPEDEEAISSVTTIISDTLILQQLVHEEGMHIISMYQTEGDTVIL